MSFSNAPDAVLLGRVAGSLAVDEAFVEKDWYVVEAIAVLIDLGTDELTPIFSGGTSLLKGYGLIKRFSEDIDFKLALSEAFLSKTGNQQRKVLSAFKKELASAWEAAGFSNILVESGSSNAFIKIELDYPTVLAGHDALRAHILAELSAKAPRLAPQERPLTSFVAQYRGESPEVPSVPCVDPVETAADKLSAFCWRALVRERGGKKDDPTIIRHVHDLAALDTIAAADARFGGLLQEALVADTDRGNGVVAHLAPGERLAAMLAKVAGDAEYANDYRRFVEGMAFAGAVEVPTFDAAMLALRRLSERLPN